MAAHRQTAAAAASAQLFNPDIQTSVESVPRSTNVLASSPPTDIASDADTSECRTSLNALRTPSLVADSESADDSEHDENDDGVHLGTGRSVASGPVGYNGFFGVSGNASASSATTASMRRSAVEDGSNTSLVVSTILGANTTVARSQISIAVYTFGEATIVDRLTTPAEIVAFAAVSYPMELDVADQIVDQDDGVLRMPERSEKRFGEQSTAMQMWLDDDADYLQYNISYGGRL